MRKASGILTFITLLALMVFAASSPAAATGGGNNNNAPGFNGTVKIHEEPGEAEPIMKNEPHVCVFHIHGFNFDSQSSGWWRIERWSPTGSGTAMQETWGPADNNGDWKSHPI